MFTCILIRRQHALYSMDDEPSDVLQLGPTRKKDFFPPICQVKSIKTIVLVALIWSEHYHIHWKWYMILPIVIFLFFSPQTSRGKKYLILFLFPLTRQKNPCLDLSSIEYIVCRLMIDRKAMVGCPSFHLKSWSLPLVVHYRLYQQSGKKVPFACF